MISPESKVGIVSVFIFILLKVSPQSLLFTWVITSPFLSNFINIPVYYSFFASKLLWDYSSSSYYGFNILEIFQYDRIVLLLLFLVVYFSKKHSKLKSCNIDKWFILLILALLFSTFSSSNMLHSIKMLIDTFVMYYFAYFLGKNLIDDHKQFNKLINAVLLLGGLLILIGLVEWNTWSAVFSRHLGGAYRISGPFKAWDSMGSSLSIIFFVVLYKISIIPENSRAKKAFFIGMLLMACFCIILTGTRTIMFAIIIGVSVGLFTGRKIIRKQIINRISTLLVVSVIVLSLYPLILTDTSFYQNTMERETGESREEQYVVAHRMFKNNPLLGIGLLSFKDKFSNYSSESDNFVFSKAGQTSFHNSYGLVAVESGLIGFLPLLCLVYSVYKKCNNYFRLETDRNGKRWGLTIIAMLTAYFLSGTTFDMFFTGTVDNKLFYLLLGATTGKFERLKLVIS